MAAETNIRSIITSIQSWALKAVSLKWYVARLDWCPVVGLVLGLLNLYVLLVRHYLPTNFIPAASSWGTYFGFTSYRCLCLSSILSLLPYSCSEIKKKTCFGTLNSVCCLFVICNDQFQSAASWTYKMWKCMYMCMITGRESDMKGNTELYSVTGKNNLRNNSVLYNYFSMCSIDISFHTY